MDNRFHRRTKLYKSNPFFCVAIAIMYKGEIIGGGVGLPWKEKIHNLRNKR